MKVVLVEGMDCAGKSAAIDLLEKNQLIVARKHRILAKDNFLVDAFKRTKEYYRWDSDEVTDALLFAIRYDLKHQEPRRGQGIFIQESILAVKGYAMLRANSQVSAQVASQFEELIQNYPKFDKTLFLTVDKNIRKQRIKERIKEDLVSEIDMLILKDYESFRRIDKEMSHLMQKYFQADTIDTTLMTVEEVADEIIKNL